MDGEPAFRRLARSRETDTLIPVSHPEESCFPAAEITAYTRILTFFLSAL